MEYDLQIGERVRVVSGAFGCEGMMQSWFRGGAEVIPLAAVRRRRALPGRSACKKAVCIIAEAKGLAQLSQVSLNGFPSFYFVSAVRL